MLPGRSAFYCFFLWKKNEGDSNERAKQIPCCAQQKQPRAGQQRLWTERAEQTEPRCSDGRGADQRQSQL